MLSPVPAAPAATYETTPRGAAAARAAAEGLGPLEETDRVGLIARFRDTFSFAKDVGDGKTFDVDAAVREMNTHFELNGIKPKAGRFDEPGMQQVTVVNRPPIESARFHIDPRTIGTDLIQLHAYYTPRDSVAAEADGFPLVAVTHHGAGATRPLPIPMDERLQIPGGAQGAVAAVAVRVPKDLPKLNQKKDAPTPAQQIVSWMEDEVVVESVKYSPMRLWTLEARKRGTPECGPFDGKHRQELGKRLRIYCFLREQQLSPATVKENYGVLRLTASDFYKQQAGDEAGASGDADASGEGAGDEGPKKRHVV